MSFFSLLKLLNLTDNQAVMKKILVFFPVFLIVQGLFSQAITIDQYPEDLMIDDQCILSSPETHPDVIDYIDINGNGIASSTCGAIITPWTVDNITWSDFGCGFWDAFIEWRVEDTCGNFENVSSHIYITENSMPYFNTYPSDITINCGDPNNQITLDNWINNLGGGILEIPCNYDLDTFIMYFPTLESCPFNGTMDVEFEIITCNGPAEMATATVTFISNTIEFSQLSSSFSESDSNAQICIESNAELFQDVDVEITLQSNSTATNGADFGPLSTIETYTFVAGPLGSQCFDIVLIDDIIVETTETIDLKITGLSSPTNEEIIGPNADLIISITDNDDDDGDGLENSVDNCPQNFNPFQEDIDQDGIGDLCDSLNTVSQAAEIADNLYLNKIYSGVILKDQSNKCWMITVQLDGSLKTTLVTCPN